MLNMMKKDGKGGGKMDGALMLSIHLMNGGEESRAISATQAQSQMANGQERCCQEILNAITAKDPARLGAALKDFLAQVEEQDDAGMSDWGGED